MKKIDTLTAFRNYSPQRWHVSGLLEQAAELFPDHLFLRGERMVTYAEARCEARALAVWLKASGVQAGDRVVVMTGNREETVISLFSINSIGAIFVVVNPLLKEAGLTKITDQCSPKVVIYDEATVVLADKIGAKICLFVGEGALRGVTRWDAVMENEDEGEIPFSGIDQDPAALIFTSGSTGTPRGVVLSHDNIRFVVERINDRLQYRPEDVIGVFLPLSFDYGLYQVFLAAQSGAALYLGQPEQVGPLLLNVLAKEEISVLPGIPTVYAAMILLMERRPVELPHLRLITNTGERLPLAYIHKLQNFFEGLQVYVMYGLTECKRVSIMLPEEIEYKPDAVGRALDGTEVFAVDANGDFLPTGQVGELAVRGRNVALGYWCAPEETAARYRNVVPPGQRMLLTGDCGHIDDEGFIYFQARSDDLLKHRGFRISPLETENAACAIPAVVEAGLVKRESDDTLHLYVTVAKNTVKVDSILAGLNAVLEPAKVPDFVCIVESLAKTVNGKIDRRALIALAESQHE